MVCNGSWLNGKLVRNRSRIIGSVDFSPQLTADVKSTKNGGEHGKRALGVSCVDFIQLGRITAPNECYNANAIKPTPSHLHPSPH